MSSFLAARVSTERLAPIRTPIGSGPEKATMQLLHQGPRVSRCGDRLELIAFIEDPKVIGRILRHLGVPTEVPTTRPARPPPLPLGRSEPWYDADDVMAP